MSLRRMLAILRKELWHITRDVRVLFLVTLVPAFLLLMLSYVFSFGADRTRMAVLDWDQSTLSRDYLHRLTADGDFTIQQYTRTYADAEAALMKGDVNVALIIPHGFGSDIRTGRHTQVQAIVDGMSPNTAQVSIAQLSAKTRTFALSIVSQGDALVHFQTVDVHVRSWYNPANKSLYSMVPGLLAIVLFMPAMALTIALAREKETGSFEGLIATPVRGLEYLLGKLLAYSLTGLLGTVFAVLLAVFWFGVPFRGSIVLLLLMTCLYFFASMGIGILIANFVASQQAAMTMFLLAFFIPSFFISGLILPIDTTATASRIAGATIPPTHYITIMRAIFLKGVGWEGVWPSAVALVVIGCIVFGLGLILFKKKIS